MNSPVDLTSALSALPHVEAPPDLAASVMARIARLDDEAPTIQGPARQRKAAAAAWRADWLGWISIGGMAAGLAAILPVYAVSADFSGLARGGTAAGLAVMPGTVEGIAVLAGGFALYLAGLYLPLRGARSANLSRRRS